MLNVWNGSKTREIKLLPAKNTHFNNNNNKPSSRPTDARDAIRDEPSCLTCETSLKLENIKTHSRPPY